LGKVTLEKGELNEYREYVFLTLISLNKCTMKDEVAWSRVRRRGCVVK